MDEVLNIKYFFIQCNDLILSGRGKFDFTMIINEDFIDIYP